MNTYKTLVLGASGSGKTIFLASMFRKLSVQARDIGFRLEAASPEQKRILTNVYETMVDPDRPWPPGTRRDLSEVKQWEFSCWVNTATATHRVFNFSYLDYAGGYITDNSVDGKSDFEIEEGYA